MSKKLSEQQGRHLVDLIEAYGGLEKFAAALYKEENKNEEPPKNLDDCIGQVRHIYKGDRAFSDRKCSAFAKVLKFKSSVDLMIALNAPPDTLVLSRSLIPWSTDEKTVVGHRMVLHHYHLTRHNDDDYFWIYTEIDFTKHSHPCCLYAPIRYGVNAGNYTAFGYILRDMLVLMFRSEESSAEMESVHLYPYFRPTRSRFERYGSFGVLWNQNPDGTSGLGGSLIFSKKFPGTGSPGEQDENTCEKLSEYWRIMNAPRCNRILKLCNRKKLPRAKVSDSKLEAILDAPAKKSGKKSR